jgi:hypothetical protein
MTHAKTSVSTETFVVAIGSVVRDLVPLRSCVCGGSTKEQHCMLQHAAKCMSDGQNGPSSCPSHAIHSLAHLSIVASLFLSIVGYL